MEPGASDGKASSGDATRLSTSAVGSGRGSRRDDDARILDGEATTAEAAGEAGGAIDNRRHPAGRQANEERENSDARADEKARPAEENGENAGVSDDGSKAAAERAMQTSRRGWRRSRRSPRLRLRRAAGTRPQTM